MRFNLRLSAALFFSLLSCNAATLSTFSILSSTTPDRPSGIWDGGNGTYSGSFTLDLSLIPSSGAFSIPISQFEFTCVFPGQLLSFSPQVFDFATLTGSFLTTIGGVREYLDVLSVDNGLFELDFIEPEGVFHGGLIVAANDRFDNVQDTKGTALAVLPISTVPEPGTVSLCVAALFTGAAFLRKTRRVTHPL